MITVHSGEGLSQAVALLFLPGEFLRFAVRTLAAAGGHVCVCVVFVCVSVCVWRCQGRSLCVLARIAVCAVFVCLGV
jgi:hypothetical protein